MISHTYFIHYPACTSDIHFLRIDFIEHACESESTNGRTHKCAVTVESIAPLLLPFVSLTLVE